MEITSIRNLNTIHLLQSYANYKLMEIAITFLPKHNNSHQFSCRILQSNLKRNSFILTAKGKYCHFQNAATNGLFI